MVAVRRVFTTATLVLLGALVLTTAQAGAAELPGVLGEFGSFTHPTGVAIDQTSGDVFVADGEGPESVDVFGPEGSGPLTVLTGTGSESFDFGHERVGVAVDDDPASASYRAVYVTDVLHNLVDKFALKAPNEYEYVCQIKGWYGSGEEACKSSGGSPTQPFVEPVGVTVDSSGNVYISSWGPEHGFVAEFDSAGRGIMQLNSSEHSGLEGHPHGLAVDTSGDLFVQNYELTHEVVKFTFSSPGVVTSETEIFQPATAIAIDPTTDDLYVDAKGQYVLVFDSSSGAQIESFESNLFSSENESSRGLAVKAATHEVYASDTSRNDVEVLGLIKVPDVTQCKTTELTPTTAKLAGEVNPLETVGAQYRFEYGLSSPGYGLESLLTDIAGEGAMPVAFEVTELTPGTTYHCRLDGTDIAGLNAGSLFNHSSDATFTTPPLLPETLGAEALDIMTGGVLFRGSVNPGNGSTTYHFEYGRTTGYGTDLPDITIGPSGFEPISVEQASEGALEPGATYHFALTAKNATGEMVGPDTTFTVPRAAAPQPPGAPESPEEISVSPGSPVVLGLPATPSLLPIPVFPHVKEPSPPKKHRSRKHKKPKKKPGKHTKKR